jgi:hypothetical protein
MTGREAHLIYQLATRTLFAVLVARGAAPAPATAGFDTTWRPADAALAAEPARPQAPARRKDSLWNGALIGASLGAIAGFLTSEAIVECSECAGFNAPLTFGVLGAGAGAALGAGIDALHSQRAAPPYHSSRVRLTPLMSHRARGLVAWIRF